MIVERNFTISYIVLDSIFLVVLLAIMFFRKKYFAILFALFGGILYFVVDYFIFHLALHSRNIENGDIFWTLLWMSLSYGITNFALIYFFVIRDDDTFLISFLIWIWWIVAPLLANIFPSEFTIHISRTTSSYHGIMGLFLVVGYFLLILHNLFCLDKEIKMPVLNLFIVGFIVQFGWELALLIGGIRSNSITSYGDKLLLMFNNSLLETNLGMPYLYLIILALRRLVNEQLKMVPKETRLTFKDTIKNNRQIKYLDILKRTV